MIQSGVLRIFRMAMRGLCSPSALLAFPSAPSAHPSAHPSARPSVPPICPPIRPLRPFWPFRLSVCLVRLSACPPIRLVPSASSLRLSALSDSRLFLYPLRSSRPPALTFLSAPPAHLPVRVSSLRSFVSVRSVRSVRSACPVRLLRPSRSGAAEFYSADFAQCFVFSSQDVFSHPISDTLLKSRRGELGISDNN